MDEITEVRVVRTRRTPSRIRQKRRRYYRRHKAQIKRRQRRYRRKARTKRLAKRRYRIRKRMHIRPGSRRRIKLVTNQGIKANLREGIAMNVKEEMKSFKEFQKSFEAKSEVKSDLVQGFKQVIKLAEDLSKNYGTLLESKKVPVKPLNESKKDVLKTPTSEDLAYDPMAFLPSDDKPSEQLDESFERLLQCEFLKGQVPSQKKQSNPLDEGLKSVRGDLDSVIQDAKKMIEFLNQRLVEHDEADHVLCKMVEYLEKNLDKVIGEEGVVVENDIEIRDAQEEAKQAPVQVGKTYHSELHGPVKVVKKQKMSLGGKEHEMVDAETDSGMSIKVPEKDFHKNLKIKGSKTESTQKSGNLKESRQYSQKVKDLVKKYQDGDLGLVELGEALYELPSDTNGTYGAFEDAAMEVQHEWMEENGYSPNEEKGYGYVDSEGNDVGEYDGPYDQNEWDSLYQGFAENVLKDFGVKSESKVQESKKLNETGEMFKDELEPGGDWYESRKQMDQVMKDAGVKGKVEPFDQYQGPVGVLEIEDPEGRGNYGKQAKIWLNSEEDSDQPFVLEYMGEHIPFSDGHELKDLLQRMHKPASESVKKNGQKKKDLTERSGKGLVENHPLESSKRKSNLSESKLTVQYDRVPNEGEEDAVLDVLEKLGGDAEFLGYDESDGLATFNAVFKGEVPKGIKKQLTFSDSDLVPVDIWISDGDKELEVEDWDREEAYTDLQDDQLAEKEKEQSPVRGKETTREKKAELGKSLVGKFVRAGDIDSAKKIMKYAHSAHESVEDPLEGEPFVTIYIKPSLSKEQEDELVDKLGDELDRDVAWGGSYINIYTKDEALIKKAVEIIGKENIDEIPQFPELLEDDAMLRRPFPSSDEEDIGVSGEEGMREPDGMAEAKVNEALNPPKRWFAKMYKKVKAGNPSYDKDQINQTIGSIWYHHLSAAKKKEIDAKEGKKYGPSESIQEGKKKYRIYDWAGNEKFGGQEFSSFDDAEEFLSEKLGDNYEEDRQEYDILPAKSRDSRYLDPNDPRSRKKHESIEEAKNILDKSPIHTGAIIDSAMERHAQKSGKQVGKPNAEMWKAFDAHANKVVQKEPYLKKLLKTNPTLVRDALHHEADDFLKAYLKKHPQKKTESASDISPDSVSSTPGGNPYKRVGLVNSKDDQEAPIDMVVAELAAEARKRKESIPALLNHEDFAHYKPREAEIMKEYHRQQKELGRDESIEEDTNVSAITLKPNVDLHHTEISHLSKELGVKVSGQAGTPKILKVYSANPQLIDKAVGLIGQENIRSVTPGVGALMQSSDKAATLSEDEEDPFVDQIIDELKAHDIQVEGFKNVADEDASTKRIDIKTDAGNSASIQIKVFPDGSMSYMPYEDKELKKPFYKLGIDYHQEVSPSEIAKDIIGDASVMDDQLQKKEMYNESSGSISVENLGAGHLGNGIVVWDRSQEENGDYKQIAHIDRDRKIKWYIKNPSPEVKKYVEDIAAGENPSVSASQPDQKMFKENDESLTEASSLTSDELNQVKTEMDNEYFMIPEDADINEGDTVYLHMHRNADFALEHPTDGIRVKVVNKLPSGLIVRAPAYIVNNMELGRERALKKGKDSPTTDDYGFISKKGMKGLINVYLHKLFGSNNRGLIALGCMSSHLIEGTQKQANLKEAIEHKGFKAEPIEQNDSKDQKSYQIYSPDGTPLKIVHVSADDDLKNEIDSLIPTHSTETMDHLGAPLTQDELDESILREAKIDWRKDNVGGLKAEYTTPTGGTYTVHASDKGWIVARGGKVFGSGKSDSVDDAKQAVVKMLKQLQIRGL